MSEPTTTDKSADVDKSHQQQDDDARSVAGSEKSTSSSRSGIPVFSGIKSSAITTPSASSTATKIARPSGAAQQHKPAVPSTPSNKLESSYDYVRRVSEDLNRFKLSDVQETEEYEEDFFGNRLHTLPPIRNRFTSNSWDNEFFKDDFFRMFPRERTPPRSSSTMSNTRRTSLGSTGTASSMDALWELHPRKLSEAGLSRYSDNSIILTEDTDSFIIGQRVFVGGTKPGQIAYIGDTQFAPGEWAGIVLDQPIGKNDGSVGGIRYFQCEPKRGVFSRLTRLTRYPLELTGAGDVYAACTSPSPTNGARKSPISPTASARSGLSISNTSLASAHVDFRVGERVIIKSSQGSKIGTLRYMGFTSFANGEWCGVELDEPRGKNDGSVEGKRYFDCRPNYGLFAPVAKVSKSPSNRKPGNCVIHSGTTPSGILRRGGSRESLASMNSSLASASTAARRVRLGVTSLTPTTKRTPPKTSTPMPSRSALQDVLKEKQQHIEQLLKERDLERAEITKAASQADEAEQKYVTLRQEFEQYKLENEKRCKDYLLTIDELKQIQNEYLAQLDDEKRKNEDLQFKYEEAAITKSDVEVTNEANINKIQEFETQVDLLKAQNEEESNKFFKVNEELVKILEENEGLKVQLEHANEKRSSLENDEVKSIELVQNLQAQLDDAQTTIKKNQEEACKQLDEIKSQMSKQTSEFEIASFKYKKDYEELQMKYTSDYTAKSSELELVAKQLTDIQEEFEKTSKELEKVKFEASTNETQMKKDLDRIRMEMSGKVLEVETFADTIDKKNKELEELRIQLVNVNEISEERKKDLEKLKSSLNANDEQLRDEILTLQTLINGKTKESEQLRKEISNLLTLVTDNENSSAEKMEKLATVTQELENSSIELRDAQSNVQNLQDDVKSLKEEISKMQLNVANGQTALNEEIAKTAASHETISQQQLQIDDLKCMLQLNERKLQETLNEKGNLEADIKQLYNSSGEESARVNSLTETLKEKETQLQSIRDEHAQYVQTAEHAISELKLAMEKSQEEIAILRKTLTETQHFSDELNQSIPIKDSEILSLKKTLEISKTDLFKKDLELQKVLQTYQTYESNQNILLEDVRGQNQKVIDRMTKEIEDYKKQVDNYVEKLKLSEKEAIEAQGALKQQQDENASKKDKLLHLSAQFEAMQTSFIEKDNVIKKLEENMQESLKEVQLKESLEQEKVLNNVQKLEEEITSYKKLIQDNNELFDKKLSELQSLIDEKNKQLTEMNVNIEENKMSLVVTSNLCDEIKAEKTTLESSKLELENNYQQLQKEVSDKEMTINDLKAQLELTKNDVNANLVNNEQKIAKLSGELSQSQTAIKMLEEVKLKYENEMKVKEEEHLRQCNDLQQLIDTLASSSEKMNTDKDIVEIERRNYQQIFDALRLTEKQKNELCDKFSEEEIRNVLLPKIAVCKDENLEELSELRLKVKNIKDALDSTNNKLTLQQMESSKLQKELQKVKSENQINIEKTANITDASIINNNQNSNDYMQLLEEKEFAENQIQFLNSIIVDMQKKNEEQKIRIEVLESGYSPDAADELKLMGPINTKIAPRMYCDICEEFDLHETEDCPLQAAEDMPAPPKDERKKEKAPPRPYCEICEKFGHSAEDCQDDETF